MTPTGSRRLFSFFLVAAALALPAVAKAITTTMQVRPGLRGTIGRRLPHPIVVMASINEVREHLWMKALVQRAASSDQHPHASPFPKTAVAAAPAPGNATATNTTTAAAPRTGALEWAGQAAAAVAPPSNDQSISVSAPMGNQVRGRMGGPEGSRGLGQRQDTHHHACAHDKWNRARA